jgi:hypothetical protein
MHNVARIFVVSTTLTLTSSPAVHAQAFSDIAKSATDAIASQTSRSSEMDCSTYADKTTKAACEGYTRATFEHQVWVLQYRQRAYEAHHSYTFWVFILVCALVVLGMYLSLREFNLDSRRREALLTQLSKHLRRLTSDKASAGASPPLPLDTGSTVSTTLGIDTTGVKLTSPVLGVIILVVSMGFFYLYLKTVYPINEANSLQAGAAAVNSAAAK